MKYFKGFDPNMQCRGFQYEVGKEYHEEKADLCRKGFHACERPLDVFNHYVPAKNRFCEVELGGVTNQTDDDSKRCGTSIKIGAEIGIPGLVKAQIEYVKSRTTFEHTDPKQATAGNSGAATSRGTASVGENGVGLARGNGVKAKGGLGAILVICEENKNDYNINAWKAAVVDGEELKADTFYKLENGEFVEVTE